MHTIDVLKQRVMDLSPTLAWALEFMVMFSFWGNLKWKHLIATVWCLILGTLEQPFRNLKPSAQEQSGLVCIFVVVAYFRPQLDEKPSKLKV